MVIDKLLGATMKSLFQITLFAVLAPTYLSCYVIKQGVFQLNMMAGAQSVEKVMRRTDLDQNQRRRLMLIQDVREFCFNNLKLKPNENYTSINLDFHIKIYNVSASKELEFTPYTWWFPIVGNVPYKGFFAKSDAEQEKTKLDALGYETMMRPIGGYSTLGFFDDPIWPSMLRMDDENLVELIIHELAHSTVYIKNQTTFNETFATFVGKTGAQLYFAARFGPDNDSAKKIAKDHSDEKLYNAFFSDLYQKLDDIYSSSINDEEKRKQKYQAMHEAEKSFLSSQLSKIYQGVKFSQINNAYLSSFKRYDMDESAFSDLFALVKKDFSRFFEEIDKLRQDSAPFLGLKKRVDILRKG